MFSIIGYLGVVLWLSVPLLWLAYWYRQHRWFSHLALVLTLAAFVCAKVNSVTHVNRIQSLPGGQQTELKSRQDSIHQAALQGRSTEVAQVNFAEDAAGEFLDKAGMDEADLKYLGNAEKTAVPEWKKQKKSRTQDAGKDAPPEDKLEANIGGPEAASGVDVGLPDESSKSPPLQMSESDTTTARRLDRWNLAVTRFLILAAVLILASDYLRRANIYAHALIPLPLPSVWINSLTPMPSSVLRPDPPRRSVPAELEWLARRGDSFVYMTDQSAAASAALAHLETHPKRRQLSQVLRVADGQDGINDDFIFESLWFGRASFVVDSAERAKAMLVHFILRLEERRATRARSTQTVHIVWDLDAPVPGATSESFIRLVSTAGFSLFVTRQPGKKI